ncbi:MAG: DUF4912 domain-containing protein [Planctomycetota bacterium]
MPDSDLQRSTVKQLREIADSLGIRGRSKLRKQDLIRAIELARDEPPAAAAPDPETHANPSSATSAPPQAARLSPGPNGEPGLPVPDHYGEDRLVLLVQDPHHLIAYWEISDQRIGEARSRLQENGTPVLILHTTGGAEQRIIDLRGGNYYVTVAPGSCYHAELALRSQDGALALLAKSNPVETPSNGPSENLDEQWMSVDETFSELLLRAGLNEQPSSASAQRDRAMVSRLWQRVGVVNPSSGELISSRALSSGIWQH